MGRYSEEKRKTEIQKKIDRLRKIQENNKKRIKLAKSAGKKQGIDVELKNTGKIAMDKIEKDIIPQFRRAGLDFFTNNIVTRAITEQILKSALRGEKLLEEYTEELTTKETPQLSEQKKGNLQRTNRFTQIFAKLRNLLVRPKKQQTQITEENIGRAKRNISLYGEINEGMENYTLRENIIDSIVNVLTYPHDGSIPMMGRSVPALVNREVVPILIKLGLEDLIPELKEKIMENYRRAEEGNYTPETENIYIPNFSQGQGISTEGIEPGEE